MPPQPSAVRTSKRLKLVYNPNGEGYLLTLTHTKEGAAPVNLTVPVSRAEFVVRAVGPCRHVCVLDASAGPEPMNKGTAVRPVVTCLGALLQVLKHLAGYLIPRMLGFDMLFEGAGAVPTNLTNGAPGGNGY